MEINRKRVARRLVSGLMAGAMVLGGLAISGGTASAKTPLSPSTNRIAGADRYETAVAIARNQIGTGNPTDGLVIATGESSADALAAAVLTTDNRPMLLVRKDSIPSSVADFLADYKSSLATAAAPKIYVVGGESAISADVLAAITAAVTTTGDTTPPTVTRVSGADRYATAKAIADVAGITDATDTLIIANGEDGKWADALSAGPLSAEKEWPIVLTNSTGLEASAQAAIDAYLAMPGSAKSILIVGGPAVVSPSVEEYLITTKAVAPANVRRIGGADRYNTNLLFNVYMLGDLAPALVGFAPLGIFLGGTVALVSGEAPYDALVAASWAAKKGAHLALTPVAGGNVNTLTLSGTLEVLSEAKTNSNLYVLGGRNAVADSAKNAYVAASTATDLTASLSGCTVGATSVMLTLSGKLTSTEWSKVSESAAALFKKNAVAHNAQSLIDLYSPGGTKRLAFLVTTSALALDDVMKFGGFVEGTTVSGTTYVPTRNIGSASCTATYDLVKPTATLRAWSGVGSGATVTTSAGAMFLLTTSEGVTLGNGVTVSAGALTVGTSGATNSSPAKVAFLNGSLTKWMIQLDSADASFPALSASAPYNTVTLGAAYIKDSGGNSPATNPAATALPDVVGPVLSAAGTTCVASAQASWTAGALTLSAAKDGALDGALGNQYTMSVVNQRGLMAPTVVVDATAKTITVTADTGYHTVGDVTMALKNAWLEDPYLGSLSSSGTPTSLLTKTTLPAVSLAGATDCSVTLAADEPFVMNDGFTVAVGGLSSGYVTGATVSAAQSFDATGDFLSNAKVSRTLTFTTKLLGSASVGFLATVAGPNDLKGNVGTTPVTFTVS